MMLDSLPGSVNKALSIVNPRPPLVKVTEIDEDRNALMSAASQKSLTFSYTSR